LLLFLNAGPLLILKDCPIIFLIPDSYLDELFELSD
jgi:hypothetical protein